MQSWNVRISSWHSLSNLFCQSMSLNLWLLVLHPAQSWPSTTQATLLTRLRELKDTPMARLSHLPNRGWMMLDDEVLVVLVHPLVIKKTDHLMRIFPAFRTSIYRGFTIAAHPLVMEQFAIMLLKMVHVWMICLFPIMILFVLVYPLVIKRGWLYFFLEMEVYSWENHIHGGN